MFHTIKIILISILVHGAFLSMPRCDAQQTPQSSPVTDELSRLESDLKLTGKSDQSVLERLTAIEQIVFGASQPGALMSRLDKVNQTLTAKNATPAIDTEPDKHLQNPGESQEAYLKRMIDAFPLENLQTTRFFRIEPVTSASEAKGDYLDVIMKATNNRVLRFKEMPIPVYITPFADRNYMSACIRGFENWEIRTKGLVRFVEVDSPDSARIRVIWNRLGLKKDGNDCALGAHTVTKWKKKGSGKIAMLSVGAVPIPLYIPKLGPKYKVPPQIIEVNLDLLNSRPLKTRQLLLQNLVTHELGHALGMLGHSQIKSDMMYSVTDEYSRISARDVNTLIRLYQMKVEIPL